MRRSSRGLLGLLAVAFVMVLVQAMPIGMAAPEKDFPLCIQGCNDARDMCNDQCKLDCGAMFPDDESSRDACISACKDICTAQSADCKAECQAVKDGGSPPEP